MDPVTITTYRDGPLLVRGDAELRDQDGNPIEKPTSVVALCRCGKSRRQPFCDATHKLAGFQAPGDGPVPCARQAPSGRSRPRRVTE